MSQPLGSSAFSASIWPSGSLAPSTSAFSCSGASDFCAGSCAYWAGASAFGLPCRVCGAPAGRVIEGGAAASALCSSPTVRSTEPPTPDMA